MKRTVLIPESMGVASEGASMASFHEAGPGASPRATLQAIRVGPIAQSIAKPLIVNGHYLHSYPGVARSLPSVRFSGVPSWVC